MTQLETLFFRVNTKSLGAGAKSCDIDQAEVDMNCTNRITDSVSRGRATGGTSSVIRCGQNIMSFLIN